MKLSLSPTLRVDALGLLAALTLTAGAAALALGPKLLSPTQTYAQQQDHLDARRKQAQDIDRQADAARKNLDGLNSQAITAVQLKPANTINQRLGEMSNLAAPCDISITSLSPGTPAAQPPAPAAGAPAPPAPELKAAIIPIKLAGTGAYPDIACFLHMLHDDFRDTALTSLRITATPDPKQSEKQIASFSIDLAWYAAPAGSDGAPPKQ